MDQNSDTNAKLAVLEQKIDKMTVIVNKLRRYFLITGIITILAIVLPLIGLVFVIPQFITNYVQPLQGNF
jgi:hypothetical protein